MADGKQLDRLLTAAFITALVVGTLVRIVLIILPGSPVTDVFYYDSQGVTYLVHLMDPYGNSYAVPPALATPGASNVFAYLPGDFVFLVPGWGLSDIRFGLVAADVIIAVSLRLFGTRKARVGSVICFLFPAIVLFSTWFINDGLPAIAFVSLAFLSELKQRSRLACLFWGVSLASSQEAWLLLPFYAKYSLGRGKYLETAASLATAAAFAVPFLIWNASTFIHDTVLFQFSRSALPLYYSGPFGPNVNPNLQGMLTTLGFSAPFAVRGVFTIAALAFLIWKSGNSLTSMAIFGAAFVSLGLFLLAGDFYWSYLELPFFLLLAWWAMKGEQTHIDGSFNT